MSVTVEILEDGKPPLRYSVKDFDELTLDDWRTLTIPKLDESWMQKLASKMGLRDELEVTYEMLKRHTGIPKTKLRRLPPSEAETLIEAIGETIKLAMEATKEDPDYTPPETLTVNGKTYNVPKDLERQTVYGQWADLSTVADLDHEADVFARILAILLTEPGKPYDGDEVKAKEVDMLGLKLVDVFALASFFFSSSERFRNAVSRSFQALITSKRQAAMNMLKLLPATTEESPRPGPLPN